MVPIARAGTELACVLSKENLDLMYTKANWEVGVEKKKTFEGKGRGTGGRRERRGVAHIIQGTRGSSFLTPKGGGRRPGGQIRGILDKPFSEGGEKSQGEKDLGWTRSTQDPVS